MGYIRKALDEGFWEMYVWVGGVGSGTVFFRKMALSVNAFFASSGQVSDIPAPPPIPITGCALGGGAPPHFGAGEFKKYVLEKVWTVGELCEGIIMKKWGTTSLLIGS